MDKKIKLISGFTLVEILIAIAVVLTMFMVGYASLSTPKSENKLKAAQREVASAISMAHSYALQGKTVDKVLPRYWGFKFTSNSSYEIFYVHIGDSTEHTAESYALKNGVKLNNSVTPANTKMTFQIPNGDIAFVSGSSLTLTLDLTGTGSKTITINSGGAVTEGL